MASFRDLLSAAKGQITEIDTAAAEAQILANPATVVLDVREPDEYDQGARPWAVHIPRGHLEAQVEGKILDKSSTVVVYVYQPSPSDSPRSASRKPDPAARPPGA